MSAKSARNLSVGDVLRTVITAEVIAITPVVGTKLVKIKIEVENQGHRSYSNSDYAEGPSTLEFTDARTRWNFSVVSVENFRSSMMMTIGMTVTTATMLSIRRR